MPITSKTSLEAALKTLNLQLISEPILQNEKSRRYVKYSVFSITTRKQKILYTVRYGENRPWALMYQLATDWILSDKAGERGGPTIFEDRRRALGFHSPKDFSNFCGMTETIITQCERSFNSHAPVYHQILEWLELGVLKNPNKPMKTPH